MFGVAMLLVAAVCFWAAGSPATALLVAGLAAAVWAGELGPAERPEDF